MEKIYDISQSKYKQLEKIRNISTKNIDITENEHVKDGDSNSGKRMLQLFLTDGAQDVLAVEHKPIKFLNVSSDYKFKKVK